MVRSFCTALKPPAPPTAGAASGRESAELRLTKETLLAQLYGAPSWTRKVAGKTVTRRLSAEQHAQYEPWFQAHRRLRELLGELEALSLEIIESELRPATGPKRKTPAT